MKSFDMDQTFVTEVIISTARRRGEGRDKSDPIRIVTEVFTKDGELIAEYDPIITRKIEPLMSDHAIAYARWLLKINKVKVNKATFRTLESEYQRFSEGVTPEIWKDSDTGLEFRNIKV